MQSILDRVPTRDIPPLMLEFAGLGAELGADEVSVALLFAENSQLRDLVQVGSSCKEFIAKSDRPVFAACVSLNKPVELMRHIIEQTGSGGPGFEDATLERFFGVNYEELCNLYSDGAAGIMLFSGGKEIPKYMTFLKTNDREQALFIAKKCCESGEEVRIGENVIWTREFSGGDQMDCWGVVDDYIVSGNAEKQILNLSLIHI